MSRTGKVFKQRSRQVSGRFGAIDVLVNNAGFGLFGLFESASREKIQEQFDVNVFGVMDVTRAILPHFRKNKRGLVINVSSAGGIITLPLMSLYISTKFAIEGFSESLAYELSSQNIVVKLVEPGGVSTDFHKRSGEEYAQSVTVQGYEGFVAHTNKIFDQMRAAPLSTPEEIAEVIFEAATDGTSRLRYQIIKDIRPFVDAKREMSERDYEEFMRARFLPRS
ncbi:MAG TPA: SDR family NAD(P)-dependent oxidoreductase [Pseudolabrys sp.]|jgi:short-subunit dehydrogenase|nr:SDR family NAD(P)-dependent oxidoreductase [Pseudolabrys sp.]